MDGILYGSVLPFTPALCLAPSEACNYFSTSVICCCSLSTFGLSGYVEVSLSYSTILSTSSIRSVMFFVVFSHVLIVASIWFNCCGGAVDLVVLWVGVSSLLALSSALVTLLTRSSITFSKCKILDCCFLLVASWSSISR